MVDEVALDMSQVKPFEAIDDRIPYRCRVDKIEIKKASTGADAAFVEFVVTEPKEVQGISAVLDKKGNLVLDSDGNAQVGDPMVDAEGNPVMVKSENRRLFRTYTFGGSALPFLHEFSKAADPSIELNENFIFKPANYLGLDVGVRVKNEGYQEQIRARVAKVIPVSAVS